MPKFISEGDTFNRKLLDTNFIRVSAADISSASNFFFFFFFFFFFALINYAIK